MLNEVNRLLKPRVVKDKSEQKISSPNIDDFTSCNDCVNKIGKIYQTECGVCRFYYGNMFEKKDNK